MTGPKKTSFSRLMLLFILGTGSALAQTASFRQEIQALVDSVSMDRLRTHVQSLAWVDGHQSRVTFTDGGYAAAEYIAAYFESLPGITRVVRDTFYISSAAEPWNSAPIINVVAFREGDPLSDEIVLLGGHYDTSGSRGSSYDSRWNTVMAQGADDNATGVAAMMEIARILCDPVNAFLNEATLKFIAFASEEYHPEVPGIHHAGSLYDAFHMKDRQENLKAAVILDMIAFNASADYVELISNEESLWLADRMRTVRNLYTPALTTNTGLVNVPYSDHESYQIYGYPAMLLMENDEPWSDHRPYYLKNPHYHTASDTVGTLNFSLLTLVTRTTLAGIADLVMPPSADIRDESGLIRRSRPYRLGAFPNPSHGETAIQFMLARSEHVSITVINSLGREVACLWDGLLPAGSHTLQWNASRAASGLYFCLLRTDRGTEVIKLTLLK